MATSGLKRHLGLTSAQGQEADIAVLAIDPHFQVYGKVCALAMLLATSPSLAR